MAQEYVPTPSKADKVAMYAALVAMLGMAFLLIWAVYEAIYPFQYFQAPAVWPITNERKIVHPGGEVFAHVEFTKSTDLPAELGLMMTGISNDGKRRLFIFPKVSGAFPRSSGEVDVSVATLPAYTPPGVYKVDIVIWYHKIFRTVTYHYQTDEFTVE